MAKSIRIGNAILCDHAVRGEASKATLVNVYSGDIVVAEMPAALMLGLYIELLPPDIPEEISVTLRMDDKPFGRVQAKLLKGQQSNTGTIILPLFEVAVDTDVTFDAIAEAPGFRRTTVLRKRIFKRPE